MVKGFKSMLVGLKQRVGVRRYGLPPLSSSRARVETGRWYLRSSAGMPDDIGTSLVYTILRITTSPCEDTTLEITKFTIIILEHIIASLKPYHVSYHDLCMWLSLRYDVAIVIVTINNTTARVEISRGGKYENCARLSNPQYGYLQDDSKDVRPA